MCMLLLAWRVHPRYPLLIAANRDEFHRRESLPAAWWDDAPDIYGGRDAVHSGSWLACDRRGRFAVVTNVREAGQDEPDKPLSRGLLVSGYLGQDGSPGAWLCTLPADDHRRAGYNLVCGDRASVWVHSNRIDAAYELPAGIHGVSNGPYGESWPKVEQGKRDLHALLAADEPGHDALAGLLAERGSDPSAPFVVTPEYGTRCTTTVLFDGSGTVDFREIRHDPNGSPCGMSECTYACDD